MTAWRGGSSPLVFAAAGMDLAQVGILAAVYPATGAWANWPRVRSRTGPAGSPSSSGACGYRGAGIAVVGLGYTFSAFATGAALLGIGTAMVYPALLAAIGDVAHPHGVPRPSVSTGCGVISDTRLAHCSRERRRTPSGSAPTGVIAALTFASGVMVAVRMTETLAVHLPALPDEAPELARPRPSQHATIAVGTSRQE